MSRLRLATILAVALIITSCTTTKPYNPFKITQEEFYGKIKTIAVSPVAIPSDVENNEQVKARFESLVESKLREAGFVVIPAHDSAEIWERMEKQMGGYFDPVTGKRDESKFKAVKEYSLREIHTTLHADAVLYSGLQVGPAPFSGNQAAWFGATESLSAGGFMDRVLSN